MVWNWTRAILMIGLTLWHSQPSSSSSALPESGLEKAAASSAVVAGSDSSSPNGQQQQTDLETRLKRITDTMQRIRGPDVEPSDGHKSERLVVADRAPSSHGSQSPYMVKDPEFLSSGNGPIDDDESDDDNGEFGSGDDALKPDEPPLGGRMGAPVHEPPMGGRMGAPSTDGVYPSDLDHTRKPATTTTTKRPDKHRMAGPTRKPYLVEDRTPTSKPNQKTSSSASYRTLSSVSILLRLLVSVLVSLSLYTRLGAGR